MNERQNIPEYPRQADGDSRVTIPAELNERWAEVSARWFAAQATDDSLERAVAMARAYAEMAEVCAAAEDEIALTNDLAIAAFFTAQHHYTSRAEDYDNIAKQLRGMENG